MKVSDNTRNRFRLPILILTSIGLCISAAIHIGTLLNIDVHFAETYRNAIYISAALVLLSMGILSATEKPEQPSKSFWLFRIPKIPRALKILTIIAIAYASIYMIRPSLIMPYSSEQTKEINTLKNYPSYSQEALRRYKKEQSDSLRAVSSYWILMFLFPIVLLWSPLPSKTHEDS